MTRPVMDNFRPFAPEWLSDIRMARLRDLSNPDKPRRKKGQKAAPKGPRLDARAKQVVAGLDPETQRILQNLLGKK